MNVVIIFTLIITIFYMIFKFAQQESVEEYYQQTILDIEALLDWSRSRTIHPFGMDTQIKLSDYLLHQAKDLRGESEYQRAYQVALESMKAIDKAQRIYISASKNACKNK